MNQVREFFITWLALKKVQRIFWLLLSFAFIKKSSKFFISVRLRSTPRQKNGLLCFSGLCQITCYIYCCHNESNQHQHSKKSTHFFVSISHLFHLRRHHFSELSRVSEIKGTPSLEASGSCSIKSLRSSLMLTCSSSLGPL